MGRCVGFKMAARSVILRAASLCRRNVAVSSSFARRMSIFTRYREPPNGFLFNEKVSCFTIALCYKKDSTPSNKRISFANNLFFRSVPYTLLF